MKQKQFPAILCYTGVKILFCLSRIYKVANSYLKVMIILYSLPSIITDVITILSDCDQVFFF